MDFGKIALVGEFKKKKQNLKKYSYHSTFVKFVNMYKFQKLFNQIYYLKTTCGRLEYQKVISI